MDKSVIKFRVIRFEEKYALLKHEDEKIGYMLWPIENLPKDVPLGSDIFLTARTQNELAEVENENENENESENENVQNLTKTNSREKTEQQFEVMRRLLEELVN